MIVIFQIVLHTIFIFQFLLTVTFCLKSQNFFPHVPYFSVPFNSYTPTEIPLTFLLHAIHCLFFSMFYPFNCPFYLDVPSRFSSTFSLLFLCLSVFHSCSPYIISFFTSFIPLIFFPIYSHHFHFSFIFCANMHIWCSSGLIFFTRCISSFISFSLLSLDWICFFICCTSQLHFWRFFFHCFLWTKFDSLFAVLPSLLSVVSFFIIFSDRICFFIFYIFPFILYISIFYLCFMEYLYSIRSCVFLFLFPFPRLISYFSCILFLSVFIFFLLHSSFFLSFSCLC